MMTKCYSPLLIIICLLAACAEPSLPPTATTEPTVFLPTNTSAPTNTPPTANQEPTSQRTAAPAAPLELSDALPGGGFTYELPGGYLINPNVGPTGEPTGNERSILLGTSDVTDFGPLVRVSGGVLQEPFSAESLLATYRDFYGDEYGFDISETNPITTANGSTGTQFYFETTLGAGDAGTGQVTILANDHQFVSLVAIARDDAWAGEYRTDVAALIDSIAFTDVQPVLPNVAATALLSETSIIPQPYFLGWTTLTLPDEIAAVVSDTLQSRPAKLEGIIAVPEGDGRHPIALVLHGRFGQDMCRPLPGSISSPAQSDATFCLPGGAESRFDVGHANLVGALAEEGYVALAINLNDIFDIFRASQEISEGIDVNNLDNYFVSQLVQMHLDALANDEFPIDLTGRIDVSQPRLLLGHSRGGEHIIRLAETMPTSGLIMFGAPADAGLTAPPDVPLGVVFGECDGDVYYWDSQRYFEEAENNPDRTAFASSVLMEKANHNFFSGLIGMRDDGGSKIGNPTCFSEDGGLQQTEQQAFMVAYMRDFVGMLRGEMSFSVTQPAPTQLYGLPVVTNLTTAAKEILLTGEGTSENMTITLCEAGEVCHPTLTLDQFAVPGEPMAHRLTWEQPDASYTLTFGPTDATHYDVLDVRTILDPTSELNAGAAVISYTVVMEDASGNRVTLPARSTPLLHTEPDEQFGFSGMPVIAGAVYIPLDMPDGIDLTQLVAVTLRFPQASGDLLLFDVSLLRDGSVQLPGEFADNALPSTRWARQIGR